MIKRHEQPAPARHFAGPRRWILALVAASAAFLSSGIEGQTCPNPIVCENQLPGNPASQWDISGAGSTAIQGFATQISVNKGDTVGFKVDVTPAATFRIDIYRLGYYGGMGARFHASMTNIAGVDQPNCLTDASTGLVDCGNWSQSASWNVPASAVSGIYIAKLTRTSGTSGTSHIAFVVRDDAGTADLLFQTSDTTWQAYNQYGGNSFYVGGPGTNPGRAYKLSYNRPFTTRATEPMNWIFNSEYPMIRWLEANGYDINYTTGVDTDRNGAALLQHRIFLSIGHDEYWSGGQRDNVEAARAAGRHLAFFSGNELWWKVRWEPSIDGSATPYRTLVSYKESHASAKIDPSPVWTGFWGDARFTPDGARPANALTGTQFGVNCCSTSEEMARAIRVTSAQSAHPFWRNTRVATLPPGGSTSLSVGTLGWEWDINPTFGRPPGLETLSDVTYNVTELLTWNGTEGSMGPAAAKHEMTLYRHPSGALVFGAGTVQYMWALDGTHDRGGSTPDTAARQAVVNLFYDMGVVPATLQSGLVPGGPGFNLVTVPTVTGLSQTSAATAITGANLAVGTITQQFSQTVAEGLVISQSPADGIQVAPGSAVNLVVSEGPPPPVTVPSVAGLMQSAAQAAIVNASLVVGAVTQQSSTTVAAGVVISQSPEASSPVLAGSAVNLVVSSGPPPVPVPAVVGLTQSAAQSAIIAASFAVGTVTTQSSGTIAAGLVISQNPAASTLAAPGAPVALVVSSGPSSTTNLALGKTTLASSVESTTLTTARAVDGSTTTRWSSLYSDPQWLYVDLGTAYSIQRVVLNWETAYGRAYQIQVSTDAQTWVTAFTETAGNGATDDVTLTPSRVGRYVRVYGTQRATEWGYSLWELQVFGGSATPPVLVPNVVGLTQGAAQSAIGSATLTVGTITQQSSATVAVGNVISQTPPAGTNVAPGSSVALVVSTGPVVPNVVGVTQTQAGTAITNAGLTLGTVTTASHATTPSGSVISQTPLAGTSAPAGSGVNLVVSTGPAPVAVPDVVGLMQAAAQTAITNGSLTLGTVTSQSHATVASGTVISQNPVATTMVASGSAVALVVSSGPAPVPVPNVVGLAQGAAATAITNATLVVGTVSQQSSATIAAGNVISQTPTAGSNVAPGSSVALVVSSGPSVPNVIGLTQPLAATALANAGLSIGTIDSASHGTIPSGSVIPQSPSAGTSVALGSAVALTISTGPPPVQVPGVVGFTQPAAQSAILAAGLTVGAGSTQSSTTVPAGTVISQSPTGGSDAPSGSAVTLVVSSGLPPVSVPSVVGQTQSTAESAITGANLVVGTVTQQPSSTVAAGSVISQNPAAAALVAPGSSVALVVSNGPPPVAVPNVVNQLQAAAQTAITNANLVVGAISQQNHPTVGAGRVISQNPASGTQVPPGTSVSIVVSSGPPPVPVPAVTGLTQTAAQNAITSVGLSVGTVTQQSSTNVPQGSVISQNPAAATLVTPGSSVALTVSSGLPPVTVPNVVNLTQAAATTSITNASLVLGTVTTSSSATVASGSVISQTPAAGAQAPPASAVNLVVSSGPPTGITAGSPLFSDGRNTRSITGFSAPPGTVILAFVAADGPTILVTQTATVSGAGLSWTLVRRTNSRGGTSEIWRAIASSAVTNGTISASLQRTGYDASLTVVPFTGATGTGATGTGSGSNGAQSATLTTTRAGSMVFGVGNDVDRAQARTLGTNQSMVHPWVDTAAGATFWVQSRNGTVAGSGTAVTLNTTAPTNDRWNFSIVEIVR